MIRPADTSEGQELRRESKVFLDLREESQAQIPRGTHRELALFDEKIAQLPTSLALDLKEISAARPHNKIDALIVDLREVNIHAAFREEQAREILGITPQLATRKRFPIWHVRDRDEVADQRPGDEYPSPRRATIIVWVPVRNAQPNGGGPSPPRLTGIQGGEYACRTANAPRSPYF